MGIGHTMIWKHSELHFALQEDHADNSKVNLGLGGRCLEIGDAMGKYSLGHWENIRKVFIFVWGLIEHRGYLVLMITKQLSTTKTLTTEKRFTAKSSPRQGQQKKKGIVGSQDGVSYTNSNIVTRLATQVALFSHLISPPTGVSHASRRGICISSVNNYLLIYRASKHL